MSENVKKKLPEGWRWVKLGEVCQQDRQIINPNSEIAVKLPYLGLENVESNTGKIIKNTTEFTEEEGKSTTFAFDDRHVLYGKLRPYLNKVALPNFVGRCTTEIIPLLPKENIDREFLCWLLRRGEVVETAMRNKTGSRMPRADMEELMKIEIPLPPLPTQQRLAARLNDQLVAVGRARLAAQAQLEEAKNLPAAYLRQVFPKVGEVLPEGWRWVKLGEVCHSINYGHTASADYSVKEPKFLRITDIQNGQVDWDLVPGCQITLAEEITNRLTDGDIVFARTGGTTGKSFLIQKPPRGVFASYLIRLTPSKQQADSNYLYLFFQSDDYWRQIKANMRGGAQPNVNATLLSQLQVPLPPLPTQQRLAARLNDQLTAVGRARLAAQAQLNEINALPAALLRKAFNGEL